MPQSAARFRPCDPPRSTRPPAWIALLLLTSLLTSLLACAKPTVLVVGLDSANWSVLDPLIDAGYLPTIGGLVRGGASADMDCVPANLAFPCYCPPA